MTLDALQQIARYLAGVPDEKRDLVCRFHPAVSCCHDKRNELTVAGCPYEEKFAKTMDMLADSRVSLYPIDAVGLQSDSLFDAASATSSSSIGIRERAPLLQTSPRACVGSFSGIECGSSHLPPER